IRDPITSTHASKSPLSTTRAGTPMHIAASLLLRMRLVLTGGDHQLPNRQPPVARRHPPVGVHPETGAPQPVRNRLRQIFVVKTSPGQGDTAVQSGPPLAPGQNPLDTHPGHRPL